MEEKYVVKHCYEAPGEKGPVTVEEPCRVFDREDTAIHFAESGSCPRAYKVDFKNRCLYTSGTYRAEPLEGEVPSQQEMELCEKGALEKDGLADILEDEWARKRGRFEELFLSTEKSEGLPYSFGLVDPDDGGEDIIYRPRGAWANCFGLAYASRDIRKDADYLGFEGFELTDSLLPLMYAEIR